MSRAREATPPRSAASGALALVAPPVALFAVFVGLWHLACVALELPAYLVPTPTAVARAAIERGPELATSTLLTAAGALAGLGLSVVIGSLGALAFAHSRWIARAFYPYAIFLQTVPVVAIAPLIVLWCGTGFFSVVLVAHIVSLFPVLTSATTGLQRVDPHLLDLFQLYGASRWQILGKLHLPGAIPYFVSGARIASGLAVIGAIIGEFFAGYGEGAYGLGYVIILSSGQLKTELLFAAIAASTLLGVATFAGVSLAGAALLRRWRGREIDR
ncbi:MAG: ABC transporter permease [Nannocystaceae bacterium]